MTNTSKLPDRNGDGKLPAFASPGGYPLVYFLADGGILCPSCANLPEAHEGDEGEKNWRLTGADALYEGLAYCAHCDKEIVGAYEEDDPPPCPCGKQ